MAMYARYVLILFAALSFTIVFYFMTDTAHALDYRTLYVQGETNGIVKKYHFGDRVTIVYNVTAGDGPENFDAKLAVSQSGSDQKVFERTQSVQLKPNQTKKVEWHVPLNSRGNYVAQVSVSEHPIRLSTGFVFLYSGSDVATTHSFILQNGTNDQCKKGFCVFPSNVTIPENTVITFKNLDNEYHQLSTGQLIDEGGINQFRYDEAFQSPVLSSGEEFAFLFTKEKIHKLYDLNNLDSGGIATVSVDGQIEKPVYKEGTIASPLEQKQWGIDPSNVICKTNLYIVLKVDGSPACVMPQTLFGIMGPWAAPNQLPDFEKAMLDIAKNFVKTQSTTYTFDGIQDSLDVSLHSCLQSFPPSCTAKAEFKSRHAGYGNRTGEILAQVITPHTIKLTIGSDGKVDSAIMDAKWDVFQQKMIENNKNQSLSIDRKLEIARNIISKDMGDPIVGLGVDNAERIVEIIILESAAADIQNATRYFEQKYQKMVPFDIPIRIDFGEFAKLE